MTTADELERRLEIEPCLENDGSGFDRDAWLRIAKDAIAALREAEACREMLGKVLAYPEIRSHIGSILYDEAIRAMKGGG